MNKKVLYLECYSGISGDMTVAALLDLGASKEALLDALEGLSIKEFEIKIGRRLKCGLDACCFDVLLESEHKHHHHDHIHRNLYDIYNIIENSHLNDRVKEIAKKIFNTLADAESKAHGLPIDKVHFHEVGAVDSIVDIISVAFCIDNLHIDEVVISKVYEGQGHVKCQHGIIPVPVPAVINIFSNSNLTMHITEQMGEMITPTGAAIAATLQTKAALPQEYKILNIGLGAGKKDFEKANILRAMIIEDSRECKNNDSEQDGIWVLESNIDDSNGEVFGYIMDELLNSGAKDVFYEPIFMKKNRPAYKINILCNEEDINKLEEILFTRTTTIGIRRYFTQRTILKRELKEVDTTLGKVKVKLCKYQGKIKIYPEYDSIKEIMDKGNQGYNEIYTKIVGEIRLKNLE